MQANCRSGNCGLTAARACFRLPNSAVKRSIGWIERVHQPFGDLKEFLCSRHAAGGADGPSARWPDQPECREQPPARGNSTKHIVKVDWVHSVPPSSSVET